MNGFGFIEYKDAMDGNVKVTSFLIISFSSCSYSLL
jgi:hypothetical protein